ncbi:MAG TPA: hypothetical protein VFA94_13120 [Acidimicrobiales bacterium]|nr:hypothetical protein [Acidimicrobiales bacterium]
MTDEKSPLDTALDLFVYAPLGLAVTAQEELPKLIEKGRERVSGQVTMARTIGEFAVGQGKREAEKLVRRVRASEPPRVTPPASTSPERAPAPPPPAAAATPPAADHTGNGSAPSPDSLAIPGYDALSASQVVQRLAGLSPEELEAVGAYEAATRHRKTVINRIAQLQ